MSLTTCKECRAEISTNAYECPKCGAPQGLIHTRHKGCAAFLVIGLIAFLVYLALR